jgi:signal peptidase II
MMLTELLLSAVLLVVFDQLSKWLVVVKLRDGHAVFYGLVTIRRVLNRDVHGTFLRSNSALAAVWVVELAVLVAAIQFGPFFHDAIGMVALGAALGGAGSNILDRLLRDGVLDFIDFGFWPVFNLADIAIVAGVLISTVRL